MNTINKKQLIEALNIASLAVTDKDVVAGSDCYFFSKDVIKTHKDTTACYVIFNTGIEGIVKASYLNNILSTFPYDEIVLSVEENNLIISSISNTLCFKLLMKKIKNEFNIDFDFNQTLFEELPDNFTTLLSMAASSASKDIQQKGLICVNIKDDVMFSGSTFSVCKINLSKQITQMQIPVNLVDPIKKISPTYYYKSNESGWIHLMKNGPDYKGIVSCISFRHGIESLSDEEYETIIGLVENIDENAIDISQLISDEFIEILNSVVICSHDQADELNPYYNVLITYNGKFLIECKSISNKIGSSCYSLEKNLNVKDFRFYINPILLKNMKNKCNELKVLLCDNRIIFIGSNFKYSVCLLNSYLDNK